MVRWAFAQFYIFGVKTRAGRLTYRFRTEYTRHVNDGKMLLLRTISVLKVERTRIPQSCMSYLGTADFDLEQVLAEGFTGIGLARTATTGTETKLSIDVSEYFTEPFVIHLHRRGPLARKTLEPGSLVLVCVLVGDDFDSYGLEILTTAGDLSRVASTQLCVPWECESGDALEDRALAGALVAYHDKLSKRCDCQILYHRRSGQPFMALYVKIKNDYSMYLRK